MHSTGCASLACKQTLRGCPVHCRLLFCADVCPVRLFSRASTADGSRQRKPATGAGGRRCRCFCTSPVLWRMLWRTCTTVTSFTATSAGETCCSRLRSRCRTVSPARCVLTSDFWFPLLSSIPAHHHAGTSSVAVRAWRLQHCSFGHHLFQAQQPGDVTAVTPHSQVADFGLARELQLQTRMQTASYGTVRA